MEAMRQSWSDDRLDDLKDRVDVGFAQVDQRFVRLEAKIDRLDAKIDAKIDARIDRLDAKVDAKIDAATFELRQEIKEGVHQINSRFDAMQQTMIRVGGGLIGVLFASGAGLIATQI
jgi:peptidoglycan hydrolase CwlO-like protein